MDTSNLILPPALLEATENLALTLLASEPVVAYHRAKAHLESDLEARDLLERFSTAQRDLRQRQGNGGVMQADMDRLRTLQNAVKSNRVIMDYAETQQAAIAYLPEVNQEISQLIGVDFASLAGAASC